VSDSKEKAVVINRLGWISTVVALVLASTALPVAASDLEGTARLTVLAPGTGGDAILDTGTRITAGTTLTPDLGLTYRLLDRWSVQLAVLPAYLDLSLNGGVNGGESAGEVWALPTTVTVLYRIPLYGEYAPYVGAGINYGFFFSHQLPSNLEQIGLREINLTSDVGFTLQAGLDYDLGNTWFATVDLKYLSWRAEAELRDLGHFDTVEMQLDPWVFGLGVGYRF
jgi:outer membrane protein